MRIAKMAYSMLGGWSSAAILFVLARVPDSEISFHQRH
jgi:hypothetical protein